MEIALERLLGTMVRDAAGRAAGRVEEVHARRRGGEVLVTEYVLGAAGLIDRLALGPLLRALLGVRFYPETTRYTVGWEDLDLSDPARPRLRRPVADLDRRSAPRGRRSRRSPRGRLSA
jgi:hypothetical protein